MKLTSTGTKSNVQFFMGNYRKIQIHREIPKKFLNQLMACLISIKGFKFLKNLKQNSQQLKCLILSTNLHQREQKLIGFSIFKVPGDKKAGLHKSAQILTYHLGIPQWRIYTGWDMKFRNIQ